MAGAMRTMGIYLGLVDAEHAENGEYEGEYGDDAEYGDYEPEPVPARREVAPARSRASSSLGSSSLGSSSVGSSWSAASWPLTLP